MLFIQPVLNPILLAPDAHKHTPAIFGTESLSHIARGLWSFRIQDGKKDTPPHLICNSSADASSKPCQVIPGVGSSLCNAQSFLKGLAWTYQICWFIFSEVKVTLWLDDFC